MLGSIPKRWHVESHAGKLLVSFWPPPATLCWSPLPVAGGLHAAGLLWWWGHTSSLGPSSLGALEYSRARLICFTGKATGCSLGKQYGCICMRWFALFCIRVSYLTSYEHAVISVELIVYLNTAAYYTAPLPCRPALYCIKVGHVYAAVTISTLQFVLHWVTNTDAITNITRWAVWSWP